MLVRMLKISLFIQAFALCLGSLDVWAEDQAKKVLKVEVVEDFSPAHRFDKGEKWAVLIGVNKYSDPKLHNLHYCVSDVRLMEKALVKKCGYDKDHILSISDDELKSQNKPLLVNLKIQIRSWISRVKNGDTVLLYYSGFSFINNGMLPLT